jgi:hypothetical protein
MPSIKQAMGGCCCSAGHTLCTCTGVPDTITVTHSVFGTATLTYDATYGYWTGSSSYAYPGCTRGGATCPARTVPLTWFVGDRVLFGIHNCYIDWGWPFKAGGVNCPTTLALHDGFDLDEMGDGDLYGSVINQDCAHNIITWDGTDWGSLLTCLTAGVTAVHAEVTW